MAVYYDHQRVGWRILGSSLPRPSMRTMVAVMVVVADGRSKNQDATCLRRRQ
ncbi:MAG: hypothetical protein NWE95_01175 [Candidatus Bathyarchaeota archaeon]|nr:hypothetical protein [Candidatus Bathyarchaeota archaeon]